MKKVKEKTVCPNCGGQAVSIHEGDIQPSCDQCGWTVDNVIRFPSANTFLDERESFEEQYTLVINEHTDLTFVSLIGTNGRVLYQTSEETRQGALQKAFTAIVLRRFR